MIKVIDGPETAQPGCLLKESKPMDRLLFKDPDVLLFLCKYGRI
jgi:hypothetical protein